MEAAWNASTCGVCICEWDERIDGLDDDATDRTVGVGDGDREGYVEPSVSEAAISCCRSSDSVTWLVVGASARFVRLRRAENRRLPRHRVAALYQFLSAALASLILR